MSSLQPSAGLLRVTTLCIVVSVVMLPLWDGIARGEGALPILVAVGLAMASTLVFLRRDVRWRWGTIAVCGAIVVLYSSLSGASIILHRSRLVSELPDCTTGISPSGKTQLTDEKTAGPHLATGEPCVPASEDRARFRKRYPTGEMFDGFRQILIHFPGDVVRVLLVPMAALFFIITAGILFAKAMGPVVMAERDAAERRGR